MKNTHWRNTIFVFFMACMIWSGSFSSAMIVGATTKNTMNWRDILHRHIEGWIQQLSKEDKLFTDWASAQYKINDLGSNQKQWIVILYQASKSGQPLGYMIIAENPPQQDPDQDRDITETEPTFSLLEYGLGQPLFEEILGENNSQDTTLVYGGLESYWIKGSQLHDARTGEQYPSSVTPPSSARIPVSFLNHDFLLTGVDHVKKVIDPFADLFWLDSTPGAHQNEWLAWISEKAVIFSSHLYDGEVIAPFAVSGIHQWTGSPVGSHVKDKSNREIVFVALEDEGTRFLPAHYLASVGTWISKKAD